MFASSLCRRQCEVQSTLGRRSAGTRQLLQTAPLPLLQDSAPSLTICDAGSLILGPIVQAHHVACFYRESKRRTGKICSYSYLAKGGLKSPAVHGKTDLIVSPCAR